METLIEKAQKGDTEAFTQIILEINDDLYRIAKTRISNEADINDAVQETMIEMYKSIKKLSDLKKFKKWTITILINKCNRIYRKKCKKDISIEEYTINSEKNNGISEIEAEINFFDIIKILDYKERIIIVLYYMEEYSVKEIKSILRMKEKTINTYLYRARQKIKNKYYGGKKYELC